MNAETDLNFWIWVYFYLKDKFGEEQARNSFLDGPGYKVAMDAWLPFIEGAALFALYFVIMESNFYRSQCPVISADYDEAEVECSPFAALEVLKRGHATPKFSFEEYTELFSYIMKNRAEHCGLEFDRAYIDTGCKIRIKRK